MYDLKQINDRIAIEAHTYRYPHLLDTGRFDQVAGEIFAEDAVLEFGELRFEGREQINGIITGSSATLDATSHNVTNLIIHLEGDEARAQYRLLAFHWMKADLGDPLAEQKMMTIGGYEDNLVRHGDGWLVRHRRSFAQGSGIGIGHPVPAELQDFMKMIAKSKITWL